MTTKATRTPRKSKAQIEREIADVSSIHRVQYRVPGSPWVWLASSGSGTMDPDGAHEFSSREAAEKRAAAIGGPSSSVQAKAVTTRAVTTKTGS